MRLLGTERFPKETITQALTASTEADSLKIGHPERAQKDTEPPGHHEASRVCSQGKKSQWGKKKELCAGRPMRDGKGVSGVSLDREATKWETETSDRNSWCCFEDKKVAAGNMALMKRACVR